MVRRLAMLGVVVLLMASVFAVGGVSRAHAKKPPPAGTFTLSIDTSAVDFGAVDPEVDVAVPGAVDITVEGFKATGNLDVSFDAADFSNSNPGAGTPIMPIEVMRYAVSGDATVAETTMVPSSVFSSIVVTKNNWDYDYSFDFTLNVPFDYEAGTYSSSILYTAVLY